MLLSAKEGFGMSLASNGHSFHFELVDGLKRSLGMRCKYALRVDER